MSSIPALTEAIKTGDRTTATRLTREAIDGGSSAKEVLDALLEGMDDVGRRFKANEIFVPEVLIASRAMKESMAILEPLLVAAGIKPVFTAVVGTVHGDLHDIGKNLVAMMWRGANINVVDLGTDVAPEQYVEAVREHGAKIVGLSAQLTTTMPGMKEVVAAFRSAGITKVRILVGGAPLTQEYADEIGADGYAADAATAVEKARELAVVGS